MIVMIKIAVMGHGVVGSGTVEVFYKNRENICKKCGTDVDIKYILDLRDFPSLPYSDKFTKSFDDIINDDEVKVVVEVMGGLNPAYDYVKRCLSSGKSVVTSNKELVAAHGAKLLKIAKENNINFLFEASVGGGIPIIRPLSQCLAANSIDEICGILNGTTNFILNKMINEGMSFEDALKLAQQLGYAERNPSADVDGFDTCRKICILASLAFGYHVYPDGIYTEGITNIKLEDVVYAKKLGYAVKLIGYSKRISDDKIFCATYPALIPFSNSLSTVDDVFNAIMVKGDATGDVMFYGKGAGKFPTASAVVADIIDACMHINRRKNIFWEDAKADYVIPCDEHETAMYVRAQCDMSDLTRLFGSAKALHADNGDVLFITPVMKEKEINKILSQSGIEIKAKIRVMEQAV